MKLWLPLTILSLTALTIGTPAASAGSATACITYVPVGPGCATGTLGALPAENCDERGCDVTFTFDLTVTAPACGSIATVWEICVEQGSTTIHNEKTERIEGFGWFSAKTPVCVRPLDSMPLPTQNCKMAEHTYFVPNPAEPDAAVIVKVIPEAMRLLRVTNELEIYTGGITN